MEPLTNYIDIRQFLPHRPPVLMIDKWMRLSEKEVTTLFDISPDCIFVQNGYLQECGLIENAAQACSTIVGESFFNKHKASSTQADNPVIGFVSNIKKVDIYQLPPAGQTLTTRAQLLSSTDMPHFSICTARCSIFWQDERLMEAVMGLYIQEVADVANLP